MFQKSLYSKDVILNLDDTKYIEEESANEEQSPHKQTQIEIKSSRRIISKAVPNWVEIISKKDSSI